MKVVFDMDTGVDDSLALIYALNRPAYEIQGIGCVYGNVESVPMNLLQENGPGACLLSMEKTDLEM